MDRFVFAYCQPSYSTYELMAYIALKQFYRLATLNIYVSSSTGLICGCIHSQFLDFIQDISVLPEARFGLEHAGGLHD